MHSTMMGRSAWLAYVTTSLVLVSNNGEAVSRTTMGTMLEYFPQLRNKLDWVLTTMSSWFREK